MYLFHLKYYLFLMFVNCLTAIYKSQKVRTQNLMPPRVDDSTNTYSIGKVRCKLLVKYTGL
jgi:hypothetical protein